MSASITPTSTASQALASLTPAQLSFIQNLPKAELHAHLNGCIPISLLREVAEDYNPPLTRSDHLPVLTRDEIASGLSTIENFAISPEWDDIRSFFKAFETVYTLISTKEILARATRTVLERFLEPSPSAPECTYLELRTTPRPTPTLTALEYVQTVLAEVDRYPPNKAALILSLDRRMPVHRDSGSRITVEEIISIAIQLKQEGRRVVGVDLCGDPSAGNMALLGPYIAKAKAAGLRITLHISEIPKNPPSENLLLLSYLPHRLGHATFLNDEAREIVVREGIAVELCLSSNLLCKTVSNLSAHHIKFYLEKNHPIAVGTDDTLPFRTSLTAEYALLLAAPPLGLGLTEDEVRGVARGSLGAAFTDLST